MTKAIPEAQLARAHNLEAPVKEYYLGNYTHIQLAENTARDRSKERQGEKFPLAAK